MNHSWSCNLLAYSINIQLPLCFLPRQDNFLLILLKFVKHLHSLNAAIKISEEKENRYGMRVFSFVVGFSSSC
ncbi:unnamed protein product [Trifolium pratense]|uniref:Uncharacterized protein n=1 Tax=Trifolium pratense TaxID=57577 RepID=A0ACB0JI49_TRIPR|nr:unnamed protein product [Trifolium pratense]